MKKSGSGASSEENKESQNPYYNNKGIQLSY